ncbi:hypothetical protein PQ455_10555 [Sphingomonas naphthae]|uniref:Lipoprotein n=1 Tax=Sphingomonas naphthae TaxID=1813468 RepID=A0ABY7TGA0_9SPHN|nr:hypothetical protein [Sphingomonas naphthae]WCT72088.1 hypothetical protein PQ455_10555 [Sphingomonas naphthae]
MKQIALATCLVLLGCNDVAAPPAGVEKRATDQARPGLSIERLVAAEAALRAEPAVLDVLSRPHGAVKWQIAVADDGSPRWGYAAYICLRLRGLGAYDDQTDVRIVDARQARISGDFRAASLSHIRCRDEQRIDP